ncbi:MAG: hypothetical protein K2W96_28955 [Gemmataceae bacterium]|nr:hypothetical protein [Gemmataceae bacterium]
MSYRIATLLLALALLAGSAFDSFAQEGKTKDPVSQYAMDLRARKSTEDDFGKDTRKFGVEIYTDGNTSDGIYVTETGSVAVIGSKAFKGGDGKGKEPVWRHGLTLTARKAGEKDWDKGSKYGVEVFRDDVNGNLVYINENGQATAAPADSVTDSTEKGKPKNPAWKHAMDLKVRKAGEKDFGKDTKKYGVEVFHDANNGNFVYISEAGSIGVVASKLAGEGKGKDPKWQYGMELKVRKAGEKEFGKDTKKIGIEVFLDEANGSLVYITESGKIAVVPGKQAKVGDGKAKDPEYAHAMEVAVRKAGEAAFGADTKKVSVEVYKDVNNGAMIYISDSGEISVVAG